MIPELLIGLSAPVALATIATIGYLFGRSQIHKKRQLQLQRTSQVIEEIETISQDLRQSLATHHSHIERIREQMKEKAPGSDELMRPTAELSSDIARAYDEIRRKTRSLKQLRTTAMRIDDRRGGRRDARGSQNKRSSGSNPSSRTR